MSLIRNEIEIIFIVSSKYQLNSSDKKECWELFRNDKRRSVKPMKHSYVHSDPWHADLIPPAVFFLYLTKATGENAVSIQRLRIASYGKRLS